NPLGWANSAPAGSFTNLTSVSLNLPLSAPGINQPWYYTFRITNCAETLWAQPSIFIPTQSPPAVGALGATDIEVGRATFNGALSAGGMARVILYLGASDAGIDRDAWERHIDLGVLPTGPMFTLQSNLFYGQPYTYRLYASNDFGEAWSAPTAPFKTPTPHTIGQPGLLVRQFDNISGGAELMPLSVLRNKTEDGTERQLDPIDYRDDFVGSFSFITASTTFALLWEGVFRPPQGAGIYSFAMNHDDRAVLAIDLNGDGDFDDGVDYDPGELILDGSLPGGVFHTGQAMLEDRPYRIAIGYEQGPGGATMRARWSTSPTAAYEDMAAIDGTSEVFFDDVTTDVIGLNHLPPSNVSAGSATLNGSFRGAGSVFDIDVYWGTTDGGMNEASWANTASLGWMTNVAQTQLVHAIGALPADSDIYYAFRATNCQETLWSQPSRRFSTQGSPTIDHAGGATQEGSDEVRLNGTLTGGGAADVTIFWGTTDGGTNPAAWMAATSLGAVLNGPFSSLESGLLSGHPYFYRAYASNQVGAVWAGSSEAFKVDAPTVLEPGALSVRVYDTLFGQNLLDPIANLMAQPESGAYSFNEPLVFPGFTTMRGYFPALTQ
ncbi:MAG: hypothetical protein AAF492_15610, partial [Verrucomicrobiota bacterium]